MSNQAPVTRRLANGAELRVQQQPWAQQVGLCLRVAAGSHDEPPAYPGLAHFLEHLLFLGSRDYPGEQGVMAFVQRHGGLVNASTQARHTDFVCEVPAELLQPALMRLLDMLGQPLLELDAQVREREVLHAEYQARSQDADSRINHALGQALAAGHRCGAFLAGDRSTLVVESAEFQQALRDHHQRHYQARHMNLTLVGPQPAEQLLDIAEALLGALPAGEGDACFVPPADLLPLRAPCLHLQHSRSGVHLGLAVQLDTPHLNASLDLLLDALQDPAPGGLLDGLRELQLCRQLQARVLYQHRGQCLLRLDFPGATAEQGAALRAAVQSWAAQLQGDADWSLRLLHQQQAAALRLLGLSPLAAARELQSPAQDDSHTLRGLNALLACLARGDGLIELQCDEQVRPLWPAIGLDLPLQALPMPSPTPMSNHPWRLPGNDPLLAGAAVASAVLPLAALRHHPGRTKGGPAALYWRGPCSGVGDAAAIETGLLARSADLRWRGERLGISCQLSVQAAGWSLSLRGPAPLLPAFSALLVPLLLAALDDPAEPAPQGMLLRALLQRLPQLCEMPKTSRLEGLSVGLGASEQAQLAELCSAVEALADMSPTARIATGIDWQQVVQPGTDAALLLFCPLPAGDACTEAAWRVLGQVLQGRFYQRLRGELQLGYALFAGFRQLEGCRGLLFALQSPVCKAADIFEHIRAFLGEQRQLLAALDDEAVSRYRDALLPALSPAEANLARAEQLWQLHLAGLPEAHLQRVQLALTALTKNDLLLVHEQLLSASDWRVLASGAPSPA
ncbi:pyrroloquinoline quinone biosynthesis protein PqqF [Pseudomonas chengduensis]|uniref:Coenzyme PQQ synthesis protein F n=1 Tax=Pseudomonas sihuiensis TaxID=1274359 RepID=A0A1H2LJ72_9PSED|nr:MULTISPECIES: pyrroloquinoline quinone biosynthesis protein PqqF [Pseudomonas]MDH1683926.1 pyrroloquinoline quinone biosynthesis protein PqqF [Pseudomonas chengduensis]SDU80959.1 coenzyme PQQ biosynthesis probable peptidase PqqF [Pseudomonas sihuiensis]